MTEKRKQCFELMRHPLNRAYFERLVDALKDGGIYGWIDMQEVFTKEEIRKALGNKDGSGKEDGEEGSSNKEEGVKEGGDSTTNI